MPALSPTMSEGKLSKWLVKEGDKITLKGYFGGNTKMIPQYNGFEVLAIID